MNRRRQLSTILLTAIITVIAVIFVVKILPFKMGNQVLLDLEEYEELQAINQRFEKILALEKTIKEEFYKDTTQVDFDTGMIRGLFDSLEDKYSVYFDKEEYTQFKLEMTGNFSGVGINIDPMVDGEIGVVSIIEGTPAAGSGIKAGDRIYSVDGIAITEDESHNAAVGRIKGPEGTEVTLGIRRLDKESGKVEELDFTMERARIPMPLVETDLYDDVGYLRIISFDEGVHDKVKLSIEELKDQGMEALVLDLRGNPGGSLNEVIKIADELLGKQVIVSTEGPSSPKRTFESDERTRLSLPYVVLIDGYSASASEILAGAIQDTEAAPLFGSPSFGKGLVQDVISLPDGTGFKLTTSYYLTPNDKLITPEEPLTPDVSVEEIEEAGYESTYDDFGRFEEDGVLNYSIDYLKKELNN